MLQVLGGFALRWSFLNFYSQTGVLIALVFEYMTNSDLEDCALTL